MTTNPPERWKPVRGFEGSYSVRKRPPAVRSERREITHAHKHGWCTRTIGGIILQPNVNGQVALCADGVVTTAYVSTLVREAFGDEIDTAVAA